MRVVIIKALLLMLLLVTATACPKGLIHEKEPTRIGFLCGSHHCRMACYDGICYLDSKSGSDVSQTNSQSVVESHQQP